MKEKKALRQSISMIRRLNLKFGLFGNKLIGEWAASLIKPENEEIYVKEVRVSNLEKPGDDDIIDKLLGDFESKNLGIERQEIIKKIEECGRLAVEKFSQT